MKNVHIPVAPDGWSLTDIESENAQFPGVCLDGSGEVLLHWQSYQNRRDSVRVARLTENSPLAFEEISGLGQALYPVSLSFRTGVWYAWSEYLDGNWSILARRLCSGMWGDIITVETGEALFYPCLFVFGGRLYLLWTRQSSGESAAVMCVLDENGPGQPETVSVVREAYRARACQGGDGNLYLVYDAPSDGGYNLLARVRTATGWSSEMRVDSSDELASRPCVIATRSGAAVCWYSYGYGATYGVYSADLSCVSRQLCTSTPLTVTRGVGWYMNLAAASNQNGLQVVAYTLSKNSVQIRYRRGDGIWSQPARMSKDGKICAMYPGLTVGDDENITLVWQYAPINGHYDRNAQIVVTCFTPEDIERRADLSVETAENTFCIPIPAEKKMDAHPQGMVAAWLERNGYAGKTLLFGDIHGQSGISDGMGEIDQYYHRAKAKANLDFTALTDHDCYPDWISQSEWELMRTTNRLMNKDGELSCILAFEWTPNEHKYDFGHKNVYYRGDDGDIFRSGDPQGMTPSDLFNSIKAYRALCIPHHPAADWGWVSAATDWDFHDPEVQRAAEIFSRHAHYEDFKSQSKFTKNIKKMERRSVQDALARGYRLGFTAGSDSHQMEHGVEGGIVAAFADAHTREAVWDAVYNRATYGTTGARILLSLKVCGKPMGSELTLPEGEPVRVEISVLGTARGIVELIKNNQTVQSWQTDGNACDSVWEDVNRSPVDFYYLRVTQDDEHIAWSSPIWVENSVASAGGTLPGQTH